jgi:hypothetical protein
MNQPFSGLEQRPPRPCCPAPPSLALMTDRGPGAWPRANRPSPLSKPADTDPDPGPHLHLGRLRHWPWKLFGLLGLISASVQSCSARHPRRSWLGSPGHPSHLRPRPVELDISSLAVAGSRPATDQSVQGAPPARWCPVRVIPGRKRGRYPPVKCDRMSLR